MIETVGAGRRTRALTPMVRIVVGLAGLAGLGACETNNSVIVPAVTKVVAVFKDSSFDFTTLHTFAMPDTVVHFTPVTGTPLVVTRDFDQTAARGRIASPGPPCVSASERSRYRCSLSPPCSTT